MAIALDPLFEQVMIIGDNRPYLSAVIVLEAEQWKLTARKLGLDASDPAALRSAALCDHVKDKLQRLLATFPGYARIYAVTCSLNTWSIDNGMITPTMKLKRRRILEEFADSIEQMYAGH